MLERFELRDKVALVAGDGRWRRPASLALAEFGADIVLVGKRPDRELVREVEALGRRGWSISGGAENAGDIEKLVSGILDERGKIDILVNCFDLEFFKPALEITEAEWLRVLQVNLNLVFYWCRAVGRHMVSRREGRIVNIASGLGERGLPHGAAYCAAKGAVIQITRALALEWARFNVRVNAVGPGWFEGRASGENVPSNPLARYVPVHRLGRPEEIGLLVVYLASDASSYVTGHTYFTDGGAMAHA